MTEDATKTPAEPAGTAPAEVADYAATCVRFVQAAVGVALDFAPETLPVLDHYLRGARKQARARPESAPLVAAVAGAYIGEVVRRRHRCRWQAGLPDPLGWYLEFDDVPLRVHPGAIATCALAGTTEPDDDPRPIDVYDPVAREHIAGLLANLPPVSDEDYLAPSTRVEVIDIVVDAALSHARSASGL
jgi:hypothetical protein